MKVHLLVKQTIEDYSAKNPQSRIPFRIWLYDKICFDRKQYTISDY